MSVVKVCKKHGELTEELVRRIISHGSPYIECRACRRARELKSYLKRKDTRKPYTKRSEGWKQRHREKAIQKYRQNPELYKERTRIYQKNRVENLNDTYIKQRLHLRYGFDKKEIPKELIDLQRSVLAMKRIISKERKKNG